jgi:hypothetical protein
MRDAARAGRDALARGRHGSYNQDMASWRCPHCGAPQPETARCWVCSRSTTSCASCRHFRKGVTIRLGYCGLDRRHSPLTGDEERACWERSAYETVAGAAPAELHPAAGLNLWGAARPAQMTEDPTVRATGMWTEIDSGARGQPAGTSHGRSIRSRPWGRVPGQTEPAGRLAGLRSKARGWG